MIAIIRTTIDVGCDLWPIHSDRCTPTNALWPIGLGTSFGAPLPVDPILWPPDNQSFDIIVLDYCNQGFYLAWSSKALDHPTSIHTMISRTCGRTFLLRLTPNPWLLYIPLQTPIVTMNTPDLKGWLNLEGPAWILFSYIFTLTPSHVVIRISHVLAVIPSI